MSSSKELMLADLERSGLTAQDAALLKMVPVERKDAARLALAPKFRVEGYLLPYFTAGGKTTKFYRYRLLKDVRSGFERVAGARSFKYAQPPKTLNEVYLAPFLNWEEHLEAESALIITEGEKKAAAGCKAGLPVIGLGGVWNFQAKKEGVSLLPGLEEFTWKDRPVYVLFDSDAAANPDVRMAAHRLGEKLTERGADVRVGYLPGKPGAKVGLDDYLLNHTVAEFWEWTKTVPPTKSSVALHQMNDLVTYVQDPGLIYVNATGQRMAPRNYKDHAFSHYSYDISIEKKDGNTSTKKLKTAAEWLDWPHRASVKQLVYEPGHPKFHEGAINLWPGYAIEPKAGDVGPWNELLNFLFNKDAEARSWFERWAAYPIQHPGTKLRTAVLVWGRYRGTGKSQLGFTLADVYGTNAALIGDTELENADNDWAFNKQFVVADEITGQNNRKLANALKTMITRESLTINQKYVPRFSIRDCINYYFTSNDPDAFYLDATERRYFIHEVKNPPLEPVFYEYYDNWRRSQEGRQALLHHLMNLPLGDFNPMAAAPHTAAKEQMVALTRTELETYLVDIMNHPDDHLKRYGGGDLTTVQEISASFDSGDSKRLSPVLLSRKLKQVGLEPAVPKGYVTNQIRMANGQRVVLYALKNRERWTNATMDDLRNHYEKSRKMKKGKV